VARIEFYKKRDEAWLLDPRNNLQEGISFELRKDFLTGHASRILPFRFKIPETSVDIAHGGGLQKELSVLSGEDFHLTPGLFRRSPPREGSAGGRLLIPTSILTPVTAGWSSFARTISCPEQLSTEILRDAFSLAQEGIERVKRQEAGYDYCSNQLEYLPDRGRAFSPTPALVVKRTDGCHIERCSMD